MGTDGKEKNCLCSTKTKTRRKRERRSWNVSTCASIPFILEFLLLMWVIDRGFKTLVLFALHCEEADQNQQV